jgi:hypothetical protein
VCRRTRTCQRSRGDAQFHVAPPRPVRNRFCCAQTDTSAIASRAPSSGVSALVRALVRPLSAPSSAARQRLTSGAAHRQDHPPNQPTEKGR